MEKWETCPVLECVWKPTRIVEMMRSLPLSKSWAWRPSKPRSSSSSNSLLINLPTCKDHERSVFYEMLILHCAAVDSWWFGRRWDCSWCVRRRYWTPHAQNTLRIRAKETQHRLSSVYLWEEFLFDSTDFIWLNKATPKDSCWWCSCLPRHSIFRWLKASSSDSESTICERVVGSKDITACI